MGIEGIVDTGSSLVEPREAMQLDTGALERYLAATLPHQGHASSPVTNSMSPPAHAARVTVSSLHQFSHGQSNPTYLLTVSSGSGPSRQLVLRKKPPGKILASAHAVDREFRVLDALARAGRVPVPRPLVLCEDTGVCGTPFYLMEYAKGHIYLDPNLPSLAPPVRAHVYRAMAGCLAALHAPRPSDIGLGQYGDPRSYCSRQLRRWGAQYKASRGEGWAELQEVDALAAWLGANVPLEDAAPPRPAICHGDFRLDNLVFTPSGATSTVTGTPITNNTGLPQLAAVLDWELSTLGNPWADVAYNCLPYHLPPMPILKRLDVGPAGRLPDGIPSEQEYVALYCAAAGVAPPSARDWAFYLALGLFRLVAILAGVQARAKQGNASSAHALAVSNDGVLCALARTALDIIARAEGHVSSTSSSSANSTSSAVPAAGTLELAVTSSSGRGSGSSSGGAGSTSGGVVGVAGPAHLPQRVVVLLGNLKAFMDKHVYAAEEIFEAHATGPQDKRWTVHPLMEELKGKAKEAGLWNLWLPGSLAAKLGHLREACAAAGDAEAALDASVLLGAGLSHWEYAHLCEVMGRSAWAPEVFNCSAPDTGNMEVLAKYGSRAQQMQWLLPLLRGTIRSAFAMTEKGVASSDATNIQGSITREGDALVVTGRKWWTSGAGDPRCAIAIFMGKTDTSAAPHKQQSMVLVPMSAPGVHVVRPMLVYGFDDAPHGHMEVDFDHVRVPYTNLILGEGRGFEIAQGRLGPGRLHHCMRLVGAGERGIELMAGRALQRTVFGKPLAAQGGFQAALARCRIELDSARLLVHAASAALDEGGFKAAAGAIAVAKVAAPNAVLHVLDAAVQAHGGAGVSQDTVLTRLWTAARTLRIADGPDEVHVGTIAKIELKAAKERLARARL